MSGITFATGFYVLSSKFEPEVYVQWMTNFLSIVQRFYLVIYTDEQGFSLIPSSAFKNPRIHIVVKPLTEFHGYQWKDFWIKNHKNNDLLREKVCWEVNMLWSEKLWFVLDTKKSNYFGEETEFYGWCDIGYFRNSWNTTSTSELVNRWPRLDKLSIEKIYYANTCNDSGIMRSLIQFVQRKNAYGLPEIQIPPNQNSIAGGFFVLSREKIQGWCDTYEKKLLLYFEHEYLVKDDQIILVDCIFTEPERFQLIFENDVRYDNWFQFQRFLL